MSILPYLHTKTVVLLTLWGLSHHQCLALNPTQSEYAILVLIILSCQVFPVREQGTPKLFTFPPKSQFWPSPKCWVTTDLRSESSSVHSLKVTGAAWVVYCSCGQSCILAAGGSHSVRLFGCPRVHTGWVSDGGGRSGRCQAHRPKRWWGNEDGIGNQRGPVRHQIMTPNKNVLGPHKLTLK